MKGEVPMYRLNLPKKWISVALMGLSLGRDESSASAQTNVADGVPVNQPQSASTSVGGRVPAQGIDAQLGNLLAQVGQSTVDNSAGDSPLKIETVRETYPNGTPRIEKTGYRNEKGAFVEHGIWTAYRESGQKIGGGELQHGKMHGHWVRSYWPEEAQLLKTGALAGFQGTAIAEGDFVNGKLNGPWVIKDAQGTIVASWGFANGQQNGEWVWNYPNGKPQFRTNYVRGKQHGLAEKFDFNGTSTGVQNFVDGRELVRQTFYHPNGVISCEGTFLTAAEKLTTKFDWWAGFGETLFYGYVGGRDRHGKFVWFYPSGKKKIEGEYLLGQITGTWTYYNEDGTVQKIEAVAPPNLQKETVAPSTAPSASPASVPVTPVQAPEPGETQKDKATTPEPGKETTTPKAPTITEVAEVSRGRKSPVAAGDDDLPTTTKNVSPKSAEPKPTDSKKPLPIQAKDD